MKVVILNYAITGIEVVNLKPMDNSSDIEKALQDLGYRLDDIYYMCTDGDVPVYYYPDDAPVFVL